MTEHLGPTELSVEGTPNPRDGTDSPFGRTRHTLPDLGSSFTSGRVSVIIPCFNSEDYVDEAIRSALDQTWSNIEVIVIDDGSTDGSRNVIESFGDQIGTRWLDHAGAPAARNAGLEVASGEFIQFLDSDDLLLTDAIERRVDEFDDDVDAVFGDREFFDQKGRREKSTTSHPGWPGSNPLADLIRHNIHTETPLHHRRLLYSIGGFDEALPCSQELNLHIRLFLAGATFSYVPGTVSRARVHSSPDRIENTPWYLDDPDLHMRIIDHHRQLIVDTGTGLMTKDVRQALAFKLWSRGMIAGRAGSFEVARRYFDRSQSYSPSVQPEGSSIFRLFHKLLGPNATVRLLHQKESISNSREMTPREKD